MSSIGRVEFMLASNATVIYEWPEATHWPAIGEEVWITNGWSRRLYLVVRVTHINESHVICFLKLV